MSETNRELVRLSIIECEKRDKEIELLREQLAEALEAVSELENQNCHGCLFENQFKTAPHCDDCRRAYDDSYRSKE